MIYQGSKERFASSLVPLIQKCISETGAETYIELFGGGANVIDKVVCKHKVYMDANEDLVYLFNYIKSDPGISIAPEDCSFEHYSEVRADREHKLFSREYRTLIGYSASYGGRYFDGGYGRDASGKRNIYQERIVNLRNQAPNLLDIEFFCNDFKNVNPSDYQGCVFYLDPPYRGTKQYAVAPIDYEGFYSFCKKLSENNIVLISEYSMPEDFECVWEKECKVYQKSDRSTSDSAVEKLFIYKGMWKKEIVEPQKTFKMRSLY